ncbi:GntR family transcriptional regulator [Cutibacterium porci]|nr:GntR family transcriptional regulator [Cutibacterium porci]
MYKYEQVRDKLLELIETVPAGGKLPTEKTLAHEFDVSPMTVRRALQLLTSEGRIHGIPGNGTFVSQPRVTKLVSSSRSFSEAIRASGGEPGSRLVSATMRHPANQQERSFFSLDSGFVIEIRRVRLSDGVPIGLETAVLNEPLVPGILGHDLTGSLYELLERAYGLEVQRTGIVVSSRMPSPQEADLLEMPSEIPCLQTIVTSTEQTSASLERTVSLFRADMYEVKI